MKFNKDATMQVCNRIEFSGQYRKWAFFNSPIIGKSLLTYTILALLFFHTPFCYAKKSPIIFIKKSYTQLSQIPLHHIKTPNDIAIRLQGIFSFQGLYQRTIQDFSSKLSSNESNTLFELFSSLMQKKAVQLISKLNNHHFTPHQYVIKSKSASEIIISAMGQSDRGELTINFFITPQHPWHIIDIGIGTTLLSRNWRSQFNKIFRKEGINKLCTRLQKKISLIKTH